MTRGYFSKKKFLADPDVSVIEKNLSVKSGWLDIADGAAVDERGTISTIYRGLISLPNWETKTKPRRKKTDYFFDYSTLNYKKRSSEMK